MLNIKVAWSVKKIKSCTYILKPPKHNKNKNTNQL